jgi:hypothetical protein
MFTFFPGDGLDKGNFRGKFIDFTHRGLGFYGLDINSDNFFK